MGDEESVYQEYLRMPLDTVTYRGELYKNRWVVITGRSICHPPPHRHFTYSEFWGRMTEDTALMDRFGPNRSR